MGEETNDKTQGTEEEPKKPAASADDAKPDDGATGATEDDIKDKHGHPGISEGKYARDIKERDEKIAELQSKLDEASKTEQGRAELQKQLDQYKAEAADKELSYKLELAGCIDVKAAKARLEDFGGDIDKLKSEASYLFKTEAKKATGKKPEGATNDSSAKLNEARKAAGIKIKE